jgi:tetratricopeptide (TPR) repeat protein
MLVEDLHWFDPQSEAFLERLIESYPGSRTLVLTNFRPGFSARWMRHSYYRQLPLAALGGTAVGELLGGLLGVDPSLAALPGFVQERTGGNPFFVEEVVRTLLEDGTLEGSPGHFRLTRPLREVRVPASVQAVLAARIDRLPTGQKSILQTGAVIGRTFNPAVLAVVSRSAGAALEDALSALCAAELLQETGQYPLAEFRFWHPLTQEVAYGSLLSKRRRRLHVAVADALTAQEAGRLDELSAVLAWHWERAGRHLDAARWNVRAAGWALRSDLGEARRRWQMAVDLLAKTDQTPEGLALGVRARMRLMQFGARAGIALEESERLFGEARGLAERLDDTRLLTTTMFMSGTPMFMAGAFDAARNRWWLEATSLVDAAGDPALTMLAGFSFGFLSPYTGPLAQGLERVDRALAACAGDVERWIELVGYSPLARLHQFRSCLLAQAGRLGEAEAALQRCLTLARPRAEPETLAWALALSPHLVWLTGKTDDTVALASEAVRIGEDTGNVAALVLALEGLAVAHLTQGRADSAAVACERVLAHAREHRSARFVVARVLAHLARARLAAGEQNAAAAAATDAVQVARQQGGRVVECLALLTRAQVVRAIGGDDDTVTAGLNAALVLVKETGALAYEPFIREEAARLRGDEAGLREALRLFTAIGASGHARRLQAERAPAKPG